MNTHSITAELRQHAENFQNSGHSDYRQHETDIHHRVRDHAINVIDSSLTQKPELRETSPTERLERDIDTFAGAVWGISQELQQGISNPARFREALRDKAKAYDIAVPRPRDAQGLTPSEIVAYLKVEERDILDKKDRDDLEIYAVNVVGNLVDMWRKRAQTESQLSISEFMYSALDRPERNDLQRVRDISRKIGEEVLSFATGRLQGSSSQSETSERPNTNTPEIKLNPELYAAVMEISKNNTLINVSLPRNSGARPVSEEGLVDGANIIGDAERIPNGWFLPDKMVEETPVPGLHIKQEPGSPNVRDGLPEIVAFLPQTRRETVRAEKRSMLGKVTPAIYRDVDVMMYNPITKVNEQIVNFTYSYCELRIPDTKLLQELSYQDTVTGRIGSRLDVMVPLPKSLADKLQKELTEDSRKVRGLVEALVKERGEVSHGVWDGSSNASGLGVRPPSFVDDERRSPQARQLVARPRIIVPVTKKAEDTQLSLEQRVFRVVA